MDNTSLYKKPEELVPPASEQPENHQHEYEVKPGKRPIFWWGILAVVVLVVVLIAATLLSGWLTTSVIGPGRNRLPVARGQQHTVVLSSRSILQDVLLCRSKAFKVTCTVLAARVQGRQKVVTIPATYPLGKAFMQVSESPPGGTPGKILYKRALAIVARGPQTTIEPDSGGSGGGGGGGGSSSGGAPNPYGDPTPTPTPIDPYGTNTPTPTSPY